MGTNNVQSSTGPWVSTAVRFARLGGLCVVAATGLIAAGVLVSKWQTTEALMASLALAALPALALSGLAFHRVSRSPHHTSHEQAAHKRAAF